MADRQSRSQRWRYIALIALVLLTLAAVSAWIGSRQAHEARIDAGKPTLVVLPLQPAGAGHDEGVLAQGLSADWIAPLARIQGLHVIAGTSALRAQVEHFNDAQLRQRLGATHVLSGQLRDSGSEVHIDLKLRATDDGATLWTGTYASMLSDTAMLAREIAQAVATALSLRVVPGATAMIDAEALIYRDYLDARLLLDGPQRQRGIDRLRETVHKAPKFAQAHAALARALSADARTSTRAELADATIEARSALDLQEELADAHVAQAVLACHVGDWAHCMESFARAIALDPSDAASRGAYAYRLAALGYIDSALRESENAWRADPLSYDANFLRARMLDTTGAHDAARTYLDAATPATAGLVYAKWHNAVWRRDFGAAAALAVTVPQSDGFREAYIAVTEALSEPRLWRLALPLIATSERANGRINVLRVMMPNPDYTIVIAGLEKMLPDAWPSYYMLLWMPQYAALRRDPAFQNFLARSGLLEYWRTYGFPAQCRAAGDGAICD